MKPILSSPEHFAVTVRPVNSWFVWCSLISAHEQVCIYMVIPTYIVVDSFKGTQSYNGDCAE